MDSQDKRVASYGRRVDRAFIGCQVRIGTITLCALEINIVNSNEIFRDVCMDAGLARLTRQPDKPDLIMYLIFHIVILDNI